MNERRAQQRMRSLKTAMIIFNRRWSTIDCTVRNLSKMGACLQVGDQVAVPDSFELEFDATNHRCQVMWRKDNRLGVAFR